MSISIDGKTHKGIITVKYGEEFPVANRSMELHNSQYGHVLVYIISLGQPNWTNKLSIEIPIRYYLTDIISPNKSRIINDNNKKTHLTVVK